MRPTYTVLEVMATFTFRYRPIGAYTRPTQISFTHTGIQNSSSKTALSRLKLPRAFTLTHEQMLPATLWMKTTTSTRIRKTRRTSLRRHTPPPPATEIRIVHRPGSTRPHGSMPHLRQQFCKTPPYSKTRTGATWT